MSDQAQIDFIGKVRELADIVPVLLTALEQKYVDQEERIRFLQKQNSRLRMVLQVIADNPKWLDHSARAQGALDKEP
jgi:hypothetical protein